MSLTAMTAFHSKLGDLSDRSETGLQPGCCADKQLAPPTGTHSGFHLPGATPRSQAPTVWPGVSSALIAAGCPGTDLVGELLGPGQVQRGQSQHVEGERPGPGKEAPEAARTPGVSCTAAVATCGRLHFPMTTAVTAPLSSSPLWCDLAAPHEVAESVCPALTLGWSW